MPQPDILPIESRTRLSKFLGYQYEDSGSQRELAVWGKVVKWCPQESGVQLHNQRGGAEFLAKFIGYSGSGVDDSLFGAPFDSGSRVYATAFNDCWDSLSGLGTKKVRWRPHAGKIYIARFCGWHTKTGKAIYCVDCYTCPDGGSGSGSGSDDSGSGGGIGPDDCCGCDGNLPTCFRVSGTWGETIPCPSPPWRPEPPCECACPKDFSVDLELKTNTGICSPSPHQGCGYDNVDDRFGSIEDEGWCGTHYDFPTQLDPPNPGQPPEQIPATCPDDGNIYGFLGCCESSGENWEHLHGLADWRCTIMLCISCASRVGAFPGEVCVLNAANYYATKIPCGAGFTMTRDGPPITGPAQGYSCYPPDTIQVAPC